LANGRDTCIGAQADMAHQVVQQLKAGAYTREDGGAPVAFTKLALAGHSAGSEIAEVEAYSFGDIDALIVMSWEDQLPSVLATRTLAASNLACGLSASGYADFGRTDEDFIREMFHSATPAVQVAATGMRVADPCGDLTSVILGLTVNEVGVGLIQIPVLQICGADDALFPAADCKLQKLRYFGSTDKTLLTETDTGHAVTLETSAPSLGQKVADWLQSRGL
jgi:pimeloyl-ACP methyl ester carboxylesterase